MTKKQQAKYKKLLEKKFDQLGIKDQINYRVNKTEKVPNPKYKEVATNPADGAQPKEVLLVYQQAINLRRNLLKKLLAGDENAAKAFLASDLSGLSANPEPEVVNAVEQASTPAETQAEEAAPVESGNP